MAKRQIDFQWIPDECSFGRFRLGTPIRNYNNLGIEFDMDCGYYWLPDYEYLYIYTDTCKEIWEKGEYPAEFIRDDSGKIFSLSSEKYFYYKSRNLIGKDSAYILSFFKNEFNLEPDIIPDYDNRVTLENSDGTEKCFQMVDFFPVGISVWFYEDCVEQIDLGIPIPDE